jgi:RimJ/RimL family protein N-acetyltransferase
MTQDTATRTYPREVEVGGTTMTLRHITPADADVALTFARALPPSDLVFLRRDITRPEAVAVWMEGIARGRIMSLLAESAGLVHGYVTIARDDHSWSPHVAELRVMVSPTLRGKGLGRLLTQEGFALALGLGIQKVVAQMTVNQKAAIAVFDEMGFRPEALLRDHVKDRDGKTYDLVIMSHDVARFQAQMDAYGVTEALGA